LSLDTAILYSFRRCPYAMRARMAIYYAGIKVALREVDLREKPQAMLLVSPKATVPVLVKVNKKIIDESLDIIDWALSILDPDGWRCDLSTQQLNDGNAIIKENDTEFKTHLDQYKYADRFSELRREDSRNKGMQFLAKLEIRLQHSKYLVGNKISFIDIAVFPFVRQFAHVDKDWFDESECIHLQKWLQAFIDSKGFKVIMNKYSVWCEGDTEVYLGD